LEVRDDERIAVMCQQRRQRVVAEAVVHRHQRDAGPGGGEQYGREVVGVDAEVDQFVGAEVAQRRGATTRSVEKARVGQYGGAEFGGVCSPDGDPVGHPRRRHFQQRQ
jgi:hypothetical protein